MIRVVSWNVNWRTGVAAEQGELLRSLQPDVVILQELNARSVDKLKAAAGLEWMRVSAPPAGDTSMKTSGMLS